jgi:glutaredoxin
MTIFGRILAVFCVLFLAAQLSGHDVDIRNDILHITELQLDKALHDNEFLLLYYMDRRDSHCMEFLNEYLTLPQYFSSKNVNITIGVLELTPSFGAGNAFGVHHFPFVKLYIDGIDHTGQRAHIQEFSSLKQIVNMVEHTLAHEKHHHHHHHLEANQRVIFNNDPTIVKEYLKGFYGRVVYCAGGHQYHHTRVHHHTHPGEQLMKNAIHKMKKLSVRLKNEDIGFAVLNVSAHNLSDICPKENILVVSNNVSHHEDLILGIHSHIRHMYHQIKLKIHPHILHTDHHFFHHHLYKSMKPLLILFYNKKHADHYDKVLDEISIEKESFDKLTFVKASLDKHNGRRLADLVGVEERDLPCVVIVDKFKNHNMTKYKFHVPENELHGHKEKKAFFEHVISEWRTEKALKHWKSEKKASKPHNNKSIHSHHNQNKTHKNTLQYVVAQEFEALLSEVENDVVMMFYYKPNSCPYCEVMTEFLNRFNTFLTKHYNHTLKLGRSDLNHNEFLNIGFYNLKKMPVVFLYSKKYRHDPLNIGDFIRKFDIENLFYSFETHSNLPLDVTHIKEFREEVMDIKNRILGIKEKVSKTPLITLETTQQTSEENSKDSLSNEKNCTVVQESKPSSSHEEL